jgi:parvulin-like peptidyl-prolyl isomerase
MTLLRRLVLLIPIALLAGACSSADTLASVNGSAITKADLTALRASYEDPVTVDAETMRSDLSLLIVLEALRTAATEQFGVEITETDIAERLANPPERYEEVIAPPSEFADITEQAVRASAIQSLVRDAVVVELAAQEPGGFEVTISQTPQDVTRACVRHIATGSIGESTQVLERLQAGEDFETVAAEVSLDQVSPGGLITNEDGECLVWFGRAGEDFAYLAATAPLNEPAGPVVSGDGWDVIVVTERLAPSLAELTADPMEYLAPDRISALYTPWANDAIREAAVDVSPTVGRWSEAGVGIAPPGG